MVIFMFFGHAINYLRKNFRPGNPNTVMAEGRLAKVYSQNISHVEMIGLFFYIMDPDKHIFETSTEVPDYLIEVKVLLKDIL